MGKKSAALRELSRKFPLAEETGKIIASLQDKGDRETVIVTGALVELCLERAILTHLKVSNEELRNQIFQNRGPLSDFNGKIIMSQALGIVDQWMIAELRMLKNIRNAFAHTIMSIDFLTEEIIQEIAQSDLANLFYGQMQSQFKGAYDEGLLTRLVAQLGEREKYIAVVQVCCSVLGFDTDTGNALTQRANLP